MGSTISINSNIASLNAQRRLSSANDSLGQSFSRLSSGLRINKASDDAAGLAIASSLKNDSRVYGQAIRNVNDGISALSIADGAASQLTQILDRISELAEQSSNGVLSYTQRKPLELEAQALRNEFNRIVQVTKFNDLSVVEKQATPVTIQVGYSELSIDLGVEGSAAGDGTFVTTNNLAVAGSSYSTVLDDFNGDGLVDIASTVRSPDQMVVRLNNGNGTFKTLAVVPTATTTTGFSSGDFNGDGIIDLATGDFDDGTVSTFLGNGDGTFKARRITTGVTQAYGSNSQSVDFNGDGRTDIAIGVRGSNQVGILLARADGTFSVALTAFVNNIETTAVGDFDGDGDIDIAAVGVSSSNATVLLNDGRGVFTSAATSTYDLGAANATWVATGDANGDGKLDLFTTSGSGANQILLGNGNGTFRVGTAFGVGANSIEVADINGDLKLDVVTSRFDGGGNTISVHLGNGNGTFSGPISYAPSGNQARAAKFGDVTGDGITDIISSATYSGNISVLTGQAGSSSFLAEFSVATRVKSKAALNSMSQARANLTKSIGRIGASMSRLDVAASVLMSSRENYQAAATQIEAADIAEESAKLTRNNILVQASAAILAQANVQPQIAISLLRGV